MPPRELPLNEILDQNVEEKMRSFILDKIKICPEASVCLGAKEFDSLCHQYKIHCRIYGHEPCAPLRLIRPLLTTLAILPVPVTKHRTNRGMWLKGISLTEGVTVQEDGRCHCAGRRRVSLCSNRVCHW